MKIKSALCLFIALVLPFAAFADAAISEADLPIAEIEFDYIEVSMTLVFAGVGEAFNAQMIVVPNGTDILNPPDSAYCYIELFEVAKDGEINFSFNLPQENLAYDYYVCGVGGAFLSGKIEVEDDGTYRVYGSVKLLDGADASKVIVTAISGDDSASVTPAASGSFMIRLAGGEYTLTLSRGGYKTLTANVIVEGLTKLDALSMTAGDMNGDETVDASDLAMVLYGWEKTDKSSDWESLSRCDVNDDNCIDLIDLQSVITNFGE